MDRRAVERRLTKLEAKLGAHPIILHFADGNKTPMTIAGTARNFFRLVAAIDKEWPEIPRSVLLELDLLRRAIRIEGCNAQLFYLAQALIQGPVSDDPTH